MTNSVDGSGWAGPARFLIPPTPTLRVHGSQHFAGVTDTAPGSGAPPFLLMHGTAATAGGGRRAAARAADRAGGRFLGCTDVDAIVQLPVDYLADALLTKDSDV